MDYVEEPRTGWRDEVEGRSFVLHVVFVEHSHQGSMGSRITDE